MTTTEVQHWVDGAFKLWASLHGTNEAITPQSALLRLRPAVAGATDTEFAYAMLTPMLARQGQHKIDEVYDQKSADIAVLNQTELSRIIAESGLPIRPDQFSKWRPTKPTKGVIAGLETLITALATDGNLGIFKVSEGADTSLGRYFLGHFQRFEWADGEGTGVPPALYSQEKPKGGAGGPRKPKGLSKKQKLIKLLQELL